MQPGYDQRASDLERSGRDRLREFPRESQLWVYALRTLVALMLRSWLALYHRFEVRGAEQLPVGRSFVLVANHQSHLDAPALMSAMPLRWLHRVFPAAAADYFFKGTRRSAFSSIVVNALPFDREAGAESLRVCRELLRSPGNVLILFPEGTRGPGDAVQRFRSGIGRLVEGTDFPVVPCFLSGAARAFPKGACFPRPYKIVLHVGAARSYADRTPGRESAREIARDLQRSVAALGGASGCPGPTSR